MKKATTYVLFVVFAVSGLFAQDRTASFDESKMRERVKRLSADDFEGRGPGTEGGKKAAQYIADQLKAVGAKPGNKGSYFQNVKLVGVKADPNTTLRVAKTGEATGKTYKFADEFVATTGAQKASVSTDAELVFVGYGIDAPLYKWNDYKGTPADYRGKILLMMVNDPPATAAEPDLFGGKALTYYGRWTYKYEEAARRGAAGVILIHTTESAGYGWNVVRTSNGNWRYEIARTADDKTPFLQYRAWATEDAAGKIVAQAGLNLADLIAKAKNRDFQPVKTGLTVKLDLKSEMNTFDSPNVIGMLDGSDPKLKNEYVVFSGHWDHLGVGDGGTSGDRIFNGAYDNASGVAAIIGIADVLARTKPDERPKRSFVFFFATAADQGLLGAEYFAANPVVPLSKIAGNVNIDGVNFFGKTRDFSALGSERSTIGDLVNAVARERNMTVEGDMRPEQGFFFRSDHFPFAKAGVPAISLRHGDDFVKPLEGEALNFFSNYTAKYYHQPSDEYSDSWDAGAMIQNAELGLAIAVQIAKEPTTPRYKETDEFSAPDKARFVK